MVVLRFAPVAAFAALLVLVSARWSPLVRWDGALSGRAREFGADHPLFISALRVATDAGATVPFLAAGTALTVLLLVIRGYAYAVTTAFATAVVPVVWSLSHTWLYRPRPVDGFVNPTSNGFPSGHAANATTLAALVVLLLWSRLERRGRVVAVACAAVVAAFVGISRVALLAHWPSDVVGGWLLGIAAITLAAALRSELLEPRFSRSS